MSLHISNNTRLVLAVFPCWVLCIVGAAGCGADPQAIVAPNTASNPARTIDTRSSTEVPLVRAQPAANVGPVANSEPQLQPGDAGGEPAKKYTDAQLHKNLTTLVLAYQPDVRARHLTKFVRNELTPQQKDEALKLLLQNDYHFQMLIQKRAEVLNVAVDGDNTAEKLRQIRIETIELSNRLRTLVYNKILTPEQQRRRHEAIQEIRLAKKIEAEK